MKTRFQSQSAPHFFRGVRFSLFTLIFGVFSASAVADQFIPDLNVSLSVDDVRVKEGDVATFKFFISRPLDFDIGYDFRTQDVTAKAGEDYVGKTYSMTFDAGETYTEVQIETLNDEVIDNDHFELVLFNFETKGYRKVCGGDACPQWWPWASYGWTGHYKIAGLPDRKVVRADIQNTRTARAGGRVKRSSY